MKIQRQPLKMMLSRVIKTRAKSRMNTKIQMKKRMKMMKMMEIKNILIFSRNLNFKSAMIMSLLTNY